jgi:cytochrome c oxidase assembly protein subunit 15
MRRVQVPTVTSRAFLRIAQVNLAVIALNIVSGGAVRLTNSGLGCPDWPTCAQHHLTPRLALYPVIEFSNRMVVVVATLAAAVAVLAALRRAPRRGDLVWLSTGLVAGIVAEALIGAVVVYTKLNPFVVMTHFMIGIAVLTNAVVLALRAGRSDERATLLVDRRVLWLARSMLGALLVAVAAGTATTGAGPHAGDKAAARLSVPLTDMTRVHSGIVIVLVVLTLATLWLLARTRAPEQAQERGRLLILAMVVQGAIGYTQYFSHEPALLVGVHIAGATTVWAAMLWFYDGLWHHEPEGGAQVVEAGAGA